VRDLFSFSPDASHNALANMIVLVLWQNHCNWLSVFEIVANCVFKVSFNNCFQVGVEIIICKCPSDDTTHRGMIFAALN